MPYKFNPVTGQLDYYEAGSAPTYPIAASLGGTGVANGASASLTLPNVALTLAAAGAYTVTILESLTVAGRDVANTFSAAQFIDGSTNAVQLRVQGHGTQTANIWTIEKSDGTVLAGADERGVLFSNAGAATTNVFLGDNSGKVGTVGAQNVGIGTDTLTALTTSSAGNGSNNFGLGFASCKNVTTGNYNIGIGASTNNAVSTGVGNLSIGYQAYAFGNGSNNVCIGYQSLLFNGSNLNIAIGYQAGYWETGAGKLYIANDKYANEATGRTNAIIYGVMASAPASQTLRLNAVTFIMPGHTTAGVNNVLTLDPTGSGANGDGGSIAFAGKSSTTAATAMGLIDWRYISSTHASYKTAVRIYARDASAARLGLEIEASGSAPKLGFFGGTTAVQQVLSAYTSDGEGSAYTGIDNLQLGSVYATVADLNQLRVAYEALRAAHDDMRTKLQTSTIIA